ncbi:NAD(P)H-dependent oxidoreductase [Taibaiella chishuiensis]|uniref:Nitroreductase n=1 Tax=Taibaiella chishuiensis TaxID=1434707 RepID=A0A2P8CWD1_9BACT|nr:NAD(P)H-dependent oxidoreductase [Taibaiella chishuiensis]PSK89246.1 nitroreductase [Taibaiella chishuiensis]
MELIEKLNWRYAAKRMNGKKIPAEKLDHILEAIRLSASSAGLQPYKVLVISDAATKEKLKAVAYNQPQITEASEVLVFAAWDKVNEQHIDDYMAYIASERGVSLESLDAFKANFGKILSRPAEEQFAWTSRQTYIALGTGLIAAAVEEIDATPMEGFDNAAVDELLGLQQKGLKSVSILTLGYRDDEQDWLAPLKKVRRTKAELFEMI